MPHRPHLHQHADGTARAARLRELKSKGRMSWDQKTPERGSRQLAIKNHFIAMIGEYVGTVLFMIFALGGTNVALTPATTITGSTTSGEENSAVSTVNTSNLLYIALSFGFSLAVNAWIFFRVSGGLFNPAVSLGMALVGALTPTRAVLLSIVQILGGITGAAIIDALTPGPINVRTSLGGGTTVVQGLFIEMFLTSLLMLSILLLAAEKNKATFIAPIGIGLALFVAELLGVYYTGGSLNPARSFGPSVVLRSFDNYHWIYWLGPILGATLAAGFYKLLKWLQYETVLGPEDGEPAPKAGKKGGAKNSDPGAGLMMDEEKHIEGDGKEKKKNNAGTMAVSGPGMGDYHMEEGTSGGVFDSDHGANHHLEDQLNRIEIMLLELYGPGGSSQDTLLENQRSRSSERPRQSRRSDQRQANGSSAQVNNDSSYQLRSVPNPLVSPTIQSNDPHYSASTVIDSKGRSKPVYK